MALRATATPLVALATKMDGRALALRAITAETRAMRAGMHREGVGGMATMGVGCVASIPPLVVAVTRTPTVAAAAPAAPAVSTTSTAQVIPAAPTAAMAATFAMIGAL